MGKNQPIEKANKKEPNMLFSSVFNQKRFVSSRLIGTK
jgi:hypothetical protein